MDREPRSRFEPNLGAERSVDETLSISPFLMIIDIVLPSIINFRDIDSVKLPRKPPPLAELLAEHHQRLGRIVGAGVSPTDDGRYLHWDKLRFLAVPAGLSSHEEWWLAVKLARTGQYHNVPLRDGGGRPFVYLLPDRAQ